MKHYLMFNGEKIPVTGITFKEDGSISTIQIIDNYQFKSFVNIDSKEEGAEKIDFATCYVAENTEAIERVQHHLEEVKEDLNGIAHVAIPSPGEEICLDELKEMWMAHNLLQAYYAGVEMALNLLENK